MFNQHSPRVCFSWTLSTLSKPIILIVYHHFCETCLFTFYVKVLFWVLIYAEFANLILICLDKLSFIVILGKRWKIYHDFFCCRIEVWIDQLLLFKNWHLIHLEVTWIKLLFEILSLISVIHRHRHNNWILVGILLRRLFLKWTWSKSLSAVLKAFLGRWVSQALQLVLYFFHSII